MNIHTQQIDQTVHSIAADIAMLAQRTGPIVVCTGRSQSPPCGKQLQQRRRSLAPLRDHSWCRSFFIARRRSSRKVSSYLSGRSSLCCTSSPFVQLVKPCLLSPSEESLPRLPIIVFGNEDASCAAVEAYVPAGPAWNAAAARVRMLEPKGTTLDIIRKEASPSAREAGLGGC